MKQSKFKDQSRFATSFSFAPLPGAKKKRMKGKRIKKIKKKLKSMNK